MSASSRKATKTPDAAASNSQLPEAPDSIKQSREAAVLNDQLPKPARNSHRKSPWDWNQVPIDHTATDGRNMDTFLPPPPSPSTANIPFEVQHLLLPALQMILEEACYAYLRKHFPDILQNNSLTCPQAAELNTYTRELSSIGIPILRLNAIRHTAVHRIPITKTRLYDLFRMATEALCLLDSDAKQRVFRLRELAAEQLEGFEPNKAVEEEVRERLDDLEMKKREIEAEMAKLQTSLEMLSGTSPQRARGRQPTLKERVGEIVDGETDSD
jgi:hypothetical protein